MKSSKLEEALSLALTGEGISFVREVVFAPPRKFRFDFTFPPYPLAVEVQGGIFMRKGGHNTGTGISRDIEKSNHATLAGWKVIYVTASMIKDGSAIDTIKLALELCK